MSVAKTGGLLCKIDRFLGGVKAVPSGSPKNIAQRAGRRVAGKATGRAL